MFMLFVKLGLDQIVVREIVNKPQSKGEIIGRGNWKGIPERSGDATHFQQITNMGFNPHHVDLKTGYYKGRQVFEPKE